MNPAFNIKLLSILSIGNAASAEYNPFWENLIRCPICTTFLNIEIILKIPARPCFGPSETLSFGVI